MSSNSLYGEDLQLPSMRRVSSRAIERARIAIKFTKNLPQNASAYGQRTVVLGTSTLIIAFASQSLRDDCESPEDADPPLSPEVIKSLKHRLADLEAAKSVRDLLAGNPRHSISGHYIVDLAAGRYIVFKANDKKLPRLQDGSIDWNKVNRIQILSIGQSND